MACSGDMLLEALAACAGVTLSAVATAIGIAIQDGTVTAEGNLDFRGTLGVSKEAPVGFQTIRLQFELISDASEEQLASLIRHRAVLCSFADTSPTAADNGLLRCTQFAEIGAVRPGGAMSDTDGIRAADPGRTLSHADLLQLKRWNTPTIYNGWEQITRRDPAGDGFNLEETRDFMPQMGPMVGYAVTVVIEPSNREHREAEPRSGGAISPLYRRYTGAEDRGGPGSRQAACCRFVLGRGERNTHRALGCVGTITDGAIRDVDEMTNAGFKALARRLCVGHAFSTPVRWNCEVEVFGTAVRPGDLIHAESTGSWSSRPTSRLNYSRRCDSWTPTSAPRSSPPLATPSAAARTSILDNLGSASSEFAANVKARFKRDSEW